MKGSVEIGRGGAGSRERGGGTLVFKLNLCCHPYFPYLRELNIQII